MPAPSKKKWTREDYKRMIEIPGGIVKRRRRNATAPVAKKKRVRNIGGGDAAVTGGVIPAQGMAFAKNVALLHALSAKKKASNPAFNRRLIDSLSKSQVNDVQKIVRNFLKGRYIVPKLQLKRLAADKKFIYQLANNKTPMMVKKRILKQRGGIFPALIPLAGKAIGKAVLGSAIGKLFGM